jgi:hypothetical protein
MHAGMVLLYTTVQFTLWGCLYSIFLFWGVRFPFHYRKIRVSGKMRYIHITSFVSAVVIPLPGSLIQLKDGFINISNPPRFCVGCNTDLFFLSYTIPTTVFLAISCILMVFVFWTILKVCHGSILLS